MFNISAYLDKFRKAGMAEFLVKDAFIESVAAVTSITLQRKDFDIKGTVAYVRAHSLIKAQLQIKKAAILTVVAEKSGKKISDIR